MTALARQEEVLSLHPIDWVEELVTSNQWMFNRIDEDELVVEIPSAWCDFRLYFAWDDHMEALMLSCRFDMKVQDKSRSQMAELLMLINPQMPVGHFELCDAERSPVFRHTLLFRNLNGGSPEALQDLVELAISESEKFYPAFQFVLWAGKTPRDAMAAAILEPIGEA